MTGDVESQLITGYFTHNLHYVKWNGEIVKG